MFNEKNVPFFFSEKNLLFMNKAQVLNIDTQYSNICGLEEMTEQLRVLTALPGGKNSAPAPT